MSQIGQIIRNLFSSWRCRACRTRLPVNPITGRNVSEARPGVCRYCVEMEELDLMLIRQIEKARTTSKAGG